jgi:hypothetical protein
MPNTIPPTTDVIVPPPPQCKILFCTEPAQLCDVCAGHWNGFAASAEFARVRTALSDWVRRCEEEARNTQEKQP